MLIGLFPGLLAAGGIQRAGRQLAAVLQGMADERGLPVLLLSLNDPSGQHEFSFGGRRVRFRGAGRNKLAFISAAYRGARKPQLLLSAHPNLAPIGWAIRAAGHPSAQCAAVVYGIEVWEPLPAVRRHALRQAALVLACSKDTVEKVTNVQRVSRERVHLLPYCLDPDFLAASDASVSPRPSGFPTGHVVLTVARLATNERYKGIDHLIEVMPRIVATVSDLRLVIAGEGDDRLRLQDLAAKLGMAKRVTFLGTLEHKDLVACYRNCDVFALPSSGEGFGLVFLEAMAYGKPVIGGAHGGTPDIVEDEVTGFLVQHGDLEQLEKRLKRLLTDNSLSLRMGERGLERVRNDFTFSRFSDRLTTLLADLGVIPV